MSPGEAPSTLTVKNKHPLSLPVAAALELELLVFLGASSSVLRLGLSLLLLWGGR